MRILIVDDSVVMRIIVERALSHAGLDLSEVLQAANGIEGLAALEQAAISGAPIDLILSDVHMPVMDGVDFLLEKQRRNLAPGVPVIMITADGNDELAERAVASGAQGYISKPFTLEQIRTKVVSMLLSAA